MSENYYNQPYPNYEYDYGLKHIEGSNYSPSIMWEPIYSNYDSSTPPPSSNENSNYNSYHNYNYLNDQQQQQQQQQTCYSQSTQLSLYDSGYYASGSYVNTPQQNVNADFNVQFEKLFSPLNTQLINEEQELSHLFISNSGQTNLNQSVPSSNSVYKTIDLDQFYSLYSQIDFYELIRNLGNELLPLIEIFKHYKNHFDLYGKQTQSEIMLQLNQIKQKFRRKLPIKSGKKLFVYKGIIVSRSFKRTIYIPNIGVLIDSVFEYKNIRKKFKRSYCLLIDLIIQLLEHNSYSAQRDIFYHNMRRFKSVRQLDRFIRDLSATINVSRIDFNIIATPKGLVMGDLIFTDSNQLKIDLNCRESQYSAIQVPTHSSKITIHSSNAKFILVVEKYCTFYQLMVDGIDKRFDLIMITGCGYPDMRTRAFLQLIWLKLKIPVFALVDGDPHGIDLMCTYRYGSKSMAHENLHLNVPTMKWIGINADDIVNFHLRGVEYNPKELKLFNIISSRQYILENEEWAKQIARMKQLGIKVEIQAIEEAAPKYLLEIFLPYKLRYGMWV